VGGGEKKKKRQGEVGEGNCGIHAFEGVLRLIKGVVLDSQTNTNNEGRYEDETGGRASLWG